MIATRWLHIADHSKDGTFDEDCLALAQLHSDAVDYAKTGNPVPLEKIPRYKYSAKPDWSAPEVSDFDSQKYYKSRRAIGKLYRAIDLPAVHSVVQTQHMRDPEEVITLDDAVEFIGGEDDDEDSDDITEALRQRVSKFIRVDRLEEQLIAEIWDLAESYRMQLQGICADHSLSPSTHTILTEEEAVVGTIVAKCTQPRRRKDMMSKMREHTTSLVQDVEHQLAGELGTLPEVSLRRAWVAYRISSLAADRFGAKSFGWIAMRGIFDSIREIESDQAGFF